MKKQALKALTMLVSITALAFVTAVASSSQLPPQKIRADIPFEFVVGDQTLAAGKYIVEQSTTGSDDGMSISSLDGNHRAFRLTSAVSASAPKKQASLTFRRYGETYFLAQVWTSGSAAGREMVKSKAERATERELAKNSSEGNPAQNAGHEIVTIIAE